MKTPEQVRDEFADSQAGFCHCNTPGICHGCEDATRKLVKRGYDFAVKNDPRVLALVEALRKVDADLRGVTLRTDTWQVANEALRAWGEK